MTEQQINLTLEQAMILFRHLHEKDVFERFYKHHLARRLLASRAGPFDDAEKSMLSKLRHECGYSYTSKLEGMYRDILVSATFNEKFKDYCFQADVREVFFVLFDNFSFFPSISINSYQFPSISANFRQFLSISINFHQFFYCFLLNYHFFHFLIFGWLQWTFILNFVFLNEQTSPISIDLNVQVLTTGFWPMPPAVGNVLLPDPVQTAFLEFKK